MASTNCKYFILIPKTLFLIVAVLAFFVEPFKQCRPGFLFHDDTGFCCETTICREFHQVVLCEEDGGKDSCEPCPPHTHMIDNTSSHFPVRCYPYHCDPVSSKEVDVFASTIDPQACPKYCQCDMSKNYCGTNPCRCQPMQNCGDGKEQNQQCLCVPITERMTTMEPVHTVEDNAKSSTSEDHSSNNQDVVIAMVTLIVITLVAFVVVFGIAFIARKRAGRESLSIINFMCGKEEHIHINNDSEL